MEIPIPIQNNTKEVVNIHCEHFDESNEQFFMVILCILLILQILIATFLLAWTILSARSDWASFYVLLFTILLHLKSTNK